MVVARQEVTPIEIHSRFKRFNIRQATDIDRSRAGYCTAIYGAPGVGKSTTAADAADSPYGAPVWFGDAEGGNIVYAGHPLITYTDLLEPAPSVRFDNLNNFRKELTAAAPQEVLWRTLILDNMVEIAEMAKYKVCGENAPSQPDWGKITDLMLNLTRGFRDLAYIKGLNVIFIVWDKDDKEEGQPTKRELAFTPKLARVFPGLLDSVGYMTPVTNDLRRLSFEASIRTAAKMRRGRNDASRLLPGTIVFGPNDKPMVDILATVKGGRPWPIEKYNKKSAQSGPAVTGADANGSPVQTPDAAAKATKEKA